MTTAELPPVTEDPLVMFRSALDNDDPQAIKLAERLAQAYRDGINELDMGGMEEQPPDQKHLAYWRYCTNPRCPNQGHRTRTSWIIPGPAYKSPYGNIIADEFKKVYHAESLEEKYGAHKLNNYQENGLRHTGDYDPSHPQGVLERLLSTPGGILEIPLSQFLTLRMHHTPMLLSMRQDAQKWIADRAAADDGLTPLGEVPCTLGCADRTFLSQADYETHQEAGHRENKAGVAAAREMGKAMKEVMTTLANNQQTGPEFMEMFVQIMKNQNEIISGLTRQETVEPTVPAPAPKRRTQE